MSAKMSALENNIPLFYNDHTLYKDIHHARWDKQWYESSIVDIESTEQVYYYLKMNRLICNSVNFYKECIRWEISPNTTLYFNVDDCYWKAGGDYSFISLQEAIQSLIHFAIIDEKYDIA